MEKQKEQTTPKEKNPVVDLERLRVREIRNIDVSTQLSDLKASYEFSRAELIKLHHAIEKTKEHPHPDQSKMPQTWQEYDARMDKLIFLFNRLNEKAKSLYYELETAYKNLGYIKKLKYSIKKHKKTRTEFLEIAMAYYNAYNRAHQLEFKINFIFEQRQSTEAGKLGISGSEELRAKRIEARNIVCDLEYTLAKQQYALYPSDKFKDGLLRIFSFGRKRGRWMRAIKETEVALRKARTKLEKLDHVVRKPHYIKRFEPTFDNSRKHEAMVISSFLDRLHKGAEEIYMLMVEGADIRSVSSFDQSELLDKIKQLPVYFSQMEELAKLASLAKQEFSQPKYNLPKHAIPNLTELESSVGSLNEQKKRINFSHLTKIYLARKENRLISEDNQKQVEQILIDITSNYLQNNVQKGSGLEQESYQYLAEMKNAKAIPILLAGCLGNRDMFSDWLIKKLDAMFRDKAFSVQAKNVLGAQYQRVKDTISASADSPEGRPAFCTLWNDFRFIEDYIFENFNSKNANFRITLLSVFMDNIRKIPLQTMKKLADRLFENQNSVNEINTLIIIIVDYVNKFKPAGFESYYCKIIDHVIKIADLPEEERENPQVGFLFRGVGAECLEDFLSFLLSKERFEGADEEKVLRFTEILLHSRQYFENSEPARVQIAGEAAQFDYEKSFLSRKSKEKLVNILIDMQPASIYRSKYPVPLSEKQQVDLADSIVRTQPVDAYYLYTENKKDKPQFTPAQVNLMIAGLVKRNHKEAHKFYKTNPELFSQEHLKAWVSAVFSFSFESIVDLYLLVEPSITPEQTNLLLARALTFPMNFQKFCVGVSARYGREHLVGLFFEKGIFICAQ